MSDPITKARAQEIAAHCGCANNPARCAAEIRAAIDAAVDHERSVTIEAACAALEGMDPTQDWGWIKDDIYKRLASPEGLA